MSRHLEILAIQAPPHALGAPFADFASEARAAMAAHPGADLLVFPELHLFHAGSGDAQADNAALRAGAIPLAPALNDPPSDPLADPLDSALSALARELGVCLIPGTLCEAGAGGELFNTARVYGPDGAVLASYRKIFPWRPSEPYDPGNSFVVFDLPGADGQSRGRIGLTICYDAWFPEVSRQVAWLGAELIVNLVKTTTADRAQELVLARANAIVNQTFLLSLNCGGPVGMGQSLLVDPEGWVLAACDRAEPDVIHARIDLEDVPAIRQRGTCGENRLWHHFRAGDQRIPLPAYHGYIDPAQWAPPGPGQQRSDQESQTA